MSQASNEAPGLNYSSAPAEQLPVDNVSKESGVQPPEAAPGAPEQSLQPVVPLPLALPIVPMDAQASQQQNPSSDNSNDVTKTTSISASKIIEDSDLIEKVWVDKAKRIVDLNRDDPYKQSEELTGVRVDYMKKVYNKTIKTDK